MKSSSGNEEATWGLLTNHGQVLACVASAPDARLRDIAEAVGITERTALQIVNDLERAGYLSKTRTGRRNRYEIDGDRKVRIPRVSTLTVAQLLGLIQQTIEQQPFG